MQHLSFSALSHRFTARNRPAQVCRHPDVEVVDHCEIDPAVCAAARRFLPEVRSCGQRAVLLCLIVYCSLIPPYNSPYNNKTESATKTEESCLERRRRGASCRRRVPA
jgi:hypothetical protein